MAPDLALVIHMSCSLLSYVAFLTAFLCGAFFLIQERQLKRKHMGRLFHRLPSLGTLDRANLLAIGIGFGLLSIGLACGLFGARLTHGQWWSWDPKELLTVGVWGTYLLLWWLRLRATLRGRKVAVLSVLGFGVVLLTWLGVSRWLPTWHAYL